jgi:hypothetical protein
MPRMRRSHAHGAPALIKERGEDELHAIDPIAQT